MPKRSSPESDSQRSTKKRRISDETYESPMQTQDFLQSQSSHEYDVDEQEKLNVSNNKSRTPTRTHRSSKTPLRKKKTPSRKSLKAQQALQPPLDHNIQTATITINGISENIDMNLLRNVGYFHRKLARPSMEILPDKKSNAKSAERNKNRSKSDTESEDVEAYKFDFNVTEFSMSHFKMLLRYKNISEQRNDDVDKPKISAKTVHDLEQFVYAADYFLVYDIAPIDIEKCYGQCAVCESTHELLKKWKKCKFKILSEFASNLQRKLHPLSSKVSVDNLISVLDQYIVLLDECEEENDSLDDEELANLRISLQIYWIHYIKGKTYFWNIYSILKKMNEFLTKLRNKTNENEDIIHHKLFDYLPYITIIYSYVDFVNCIQRMKDGTTNYVAFIEKMNIGIKELCSLFFQKSSPEYNISELKKRWYFRLNGKETNVTNKEVMIELLKTLTWYLMEFHLDDFMIRMFWSFVNYVFEDEEFIRCIIKKCNQMEITQLAEILNGCNVQRYAERNQNFEFKYNDIITKHCYSSVNHNDNIAVLGWR